MWGDAGADGAGEGQEFIQEILEDEVTEFLGGRAKSQRRASVEAGEGIPQRVRKPRNLTLASGTVEVCRPGSRRGGTVREPGAAAVRAADEGGGRAGGAAVPARPGRGGLRVGLRGLLGDGAPLSKSTVRRLRERWVAEHAAWERRSLAGRELVYAWADGIYVKAGLEKDKAALLVVIGAMADGTKEVLAVAPGFRESAESWAAVLRGPQGPGARRAEAAGGRRQPGHLGGGPAGVAGGWGAAVLEPQDGQRPRPSAEARAGGGEAAAARGRVRGVEGRGREGSRRLRGPLRRHEYPKAPETLAGRLGPDDRVLRLSRRALEAPAHDERGRKPVRGGAACAPPPPSGSRGSTAPRR